MIAIYYVDSAGPYTMCSIEVPDATEASFLKRIKEDLYPDPTADIVVIDNNEQVRQYYLGEDE